MKQGRFTKENCLERVSDRSAKRLAFGTSGSSQQHFGRENSPRFGGRAALVTDERGVAAVEYAVICALIVVAIITGIANLGSGVSETWSNVDHEVSGAVTYSTN
jgi:Flp pilus assembly pilin Flp